MSCLNPTSPIDINTQNVAGNCDLKCAYNYNYQESSTIAKNMGNYISLSYDSFSNPPVTYNTSKYNVSEIRIYTPSLHSFNGSKVDAEFIIVHSSNNGSSPLLVCVPIKKNNVSSVSASLLDEIITSVSNNAPKEGGVTNINLDSFTINNLVAKKPFYSYTANLPYQPCNTQASILVYNISDHICDINASTLTTLKSVIQNNPYNPVTTTPFFLNSKGPGSNVSSDEIYIDCKPVGSSEEEEMVSKKSNNSNMINWDEIRHSTAAQLILAILIILGVMCFAYIGFISFSNSSANLPKSIKIPFSKK
jgi:carbonic anhydrase